MANIDLGQTQTNSYKELPLVTLGDDIVSVKHLIDKKQMSYSALDIINELRKYLCQDQHLKKKRARYCPQPTL